VLITHDSSIAGRAQRIGVMNNDLLSIEQDTAGTASAATHEERRDPQ
jgi:hypothetical protein